MTPLDLKVLFIRDLTKLNAELTQFVDETSIWQPLPGISNSAGVLTKHICGNLNHFIGHVLIGTPYERNRDTEFKNEVQPLVELTKLVEATMVMIEARLPGVPESTLQSAYPVKIREMEFKTGEFLMHLYGHLNYHLGQINYLRRIMNP